MKAQQSVAVIIDGGYWHRVCGNNSLDNEASLYKAHLKQIEEKVGDIVRHTTVVDTDPSEYLLEALSEAPTGMEEVNSLVESQQHRLAFCDTLSATYGRAVDVSLCRVKLQNSRRFVPAVPGLEKKCVWLYQTALSASGSDVAMSMRLLEYAHGLHIPSGHTTPITPTDVVVVCAEANIVPALESLNRTCKTRLWLADFEDVLVRVCPTTPHRRPIEMTPYFGGNRLIPLVAPPSADKRLRAEAEGLKQFSGTGAPGRERQEVQQQSQQPQQPRSKGKKEKKEEKKEKEKEKGKSREKTKPDPLPTKQQPSVQEAPVEKSLPMEIDVPETQKDLKEGGGAQEDGEDGKKQRRKPIAKASRLGMAFTKLPSKRSTQDWKVIKEAAKKAKASGADATNATQATPKKGTSAKPKVVSPARKGAEKGKPAAKKAIQKVARKPIKKS